LTKLAELYIFTIARSQKSGKCRDAPWRVSTLSAFNFILKFVNRKS